MISRSCRIAIGLILGLSITTEKMPGLARQAASPEAATDAWIAYQWYGGIRLIQADGSGDHALTADWTGGEQLHPDWSPDGTQIAFSADDDDGTRDIWQANADGGDPKVLFDCAEPCVWSDDPAFSPDGTRVVFESCASHDGISQCALHVFDRATDTVAVIWEPQDPAEAAYVPRWSPDGERIVFEIDRFDSASIDATKVIGSQIAVIDLTDPPGTPATPLTTMDSFATYPDWSPTDDLIVFAMAGDAGAGGPYDLYAISPDGTEPTQLTELAGTGYQGIQPSFTPDGTQVIFVYDQMWTNARVGLVDLASGEVSVLEIPATHPRLQPTE